MLKKILVLSLLFFAPIQAFGASKTFDRKVCNLGWEHVVHKHSEASYQQAWCSAHNGVEEHENADKTRVDCLTETHAVEFDFANKWAESIGQALHYQLMTGKRAKVVLILDNPKRQMVYFRRVEKLGKVHDFDVEYITNDILNLDCEGKCDNPKCRCHKKKK